MKQTITLLLLFLCLPHVQAQKIDSLGIDSLRADLRISSSQTIITADEIMERGYDNMDELLSSVPGVFISHDRTLTQIGIRTPSATASNNQRIQVLLDGLPLNNPFDGQAPAGLDFGGINMEDIAEVVVIRNASPTNYGNNAMFGVIKINTKKPNKGLRLNFDTGSFGEVDGGFAVGTAIGKAKLGFSGRMANIIGQELYFVEDSILTKEATAFGGTRFRFNLGKFSLNVAYTRRDEVLLAVPSDTFNIVLDSTIIDPDPVTPDYTYLKEALDMDGRFKDNQLYFDANYSIAIGNKQAMDIRLFLNYKNSNRTQFFRETETNIDSTATNIRYVEYKEQAIQKALWTGLEYRHGIRFLPNHQLNFGTVGWVIPFLKYNNKNIITQYFDGTTIITEDFGAPIITSMADREENFSRDFAAWSLALFMEDQIQFNDLFLLNVGGRIEINSQTKPVFAPQASLRFTPFKDKSIFRIGYSRGYRLPTTRETDVVILDNLTTTPNPSADESLVAETVNNYELGLGQKIGKHLNLDLALYHQQLHDLIWNETTMINRQNDKVIPVTGLEGGLNLKLPNGIGTYFSYNFQFNKKEQVNIPSPLCKFGTTIPFLQHFSLFVEGQYEGARLNFDNSQTLPYFLLNTNLLIRPKVKEGNWLQNLSISFRINNALNEYYLHPSAQPFSPTLTPQNGRTWQTQLTYQF